MNTLIQKRNTNRGGLIRLIIYIVIILLIISYFGLNIRTIVNSPAGQENFTYVQGIMITVWNGYLKKPVLYLWNDIFLKLIWEPAIENLTKIKDGSSDSLLSSSTPQLSPPRLIPN